MTDKGLLRLYAEALTKGMKDFPVLESLTSSSTVLTAEAIRTCQVDRDKTLETMIVGPGDRSEGRTAETAEVNSEAATGESRQEEKPSGGLSQKMFDLSPWLEQIHKLSRALEAKDAEMLHLKDMVRHVHNEAEVKSTVAQKRYDELQARFLELEEKLDIAKEDAKQVAKEHAAYEDFFYFRLYKQVKVKLEIAR